MRYSLNIYLDFATLSIVYFQRAKHVDSEDNFRSGCRNVSHPNDHTIRIFNTCYHSDAIRYYLKQRVWPEQLHLLVRCFFSIVLHADKFFYLLLVGFFSISDQFKRHWLTSLCTGTLAVRDNPWLLAIFQLADCWCCAQRWRGQKIFSKNQIDDTAFTSTSFTYSETILNNYSHCVSAIYLC